MSGLLADIWETEEDARLWRYAREYDQAWQTIKDHYFPSRSSNELKRRSVQRQKNYLAKERCANPRYRYESLMTSHKSSASTNHSQIQSVPSASNLVDFETPLVTTNAPKYFLDFAVNDSTDIDFGFPATSTASNVETGNALGGLRTQSSSASDLSTLVLRIENPPADVVTDVIRYLVNERAKFRSEMEWSDEQSAPLSER